MKKTFLFLMLITILLASCGNSTPPAADTTKNFLQALSDKDDALMLSYVCADYELEALLEFDAFALVQTTLTDLDCQQKEMDGDDALIICKGSIDATYNNEVRNFHLSERTYRVVQQGGDWLVCGYTK